MLGRGTRFGPSWAPAPGKPGPARVAPSGAREGTSAQGRLPALGVVAAALLLAAACVVWALFPSAVRAAPSFDAISIEEVSETEYEKPGYDWSIDFDAMSSERGWQHVDDIGPYLSQAENGLGAQWKGTPGWVAPIDGGTEKGSYVMRYSGGTYGELAIDAVVTLSNWTYSEQGDRLENAFGTGYWPLRQTGVFIIEEYKSPADDVDGIQNFNFYTLGLEELEVEVALCYAGTNDLVPDLMGHITTTDLDVYQQFSYGGAVSEGRIAADSPLEVSADGTYVDSGAIWLDDQDPVEYRQGLCEAYFDTGASGEERSIRFWFGTSWGAGDTPESIFFLTSELLTTYDPNDPPDDVTRPVKTADRTEGVSVGDEVEYTIDYTAHEQGVNCRKGYHYTNLDIVDVLPAEMRYVDGTGRLYDGAGGDVTAQAGEVVYEGDNENPTENTVRFEFSPDYLLGMPMEGEHYRFVFRAVLTEYPANGQRDDDNDLYVRNVSYALINRNAQTWSNHVDTKLLEPVFHVDKVADAYEYEVGDVITYTVTYQQTVKNAQSRDTVVSDNLPEGLELIAESVSATGTRDLPAVEVNGNEWSLHFDKFTYGDELQVTYQARARQSGNGTEIVNNAGIHAINAMDADDPEEIWVNTANVEVEKDVDRFEGHVGASDEDPGFFEYTVRVRNAEEGTVANGVTVTDDSLPEGMRLGRNEDGSLMVVALRENGGDVAMAWTGDRAEGTLADISYRVGDMGEDPRAEDHVHDQVVTVTPTWDIVPAGTGWQMTIDHLAHGQEVELVYRAYPEDAVSGWEVENVAEATADNSLPDDDAATVWVNQPHFTIEKRASNDTFTVNDYVSYHVKVVNRTPGTLGRDVIVSDLARTQGVELDRSSIRVYDSRGEDVTESCTVTYRHAPQGAETFIVETHRDLVAGTTDELSELYAELTSCATEAEFTDTLALIEELVASGGGASHESAATLVGARPTWQDGKVVWEGGPNPLGVDPEAPRAGTRGCETELTVEYRVKINDPELAGQTMDNTALVVSDEPNTATTDDEVVDVKGPRLQVEKSSDRDVYQVGETGRYTLVVSQTREDCAAEGVVVTDALDDSDTASIVEGSVVVTGPDGSVAEVEPEYVRAEDGAVTGFAVDTGITLEDEQSLTVTYDVSMLAVGSSVHNVAQATTENGLDGTDDNTVSVVDPYAVVTLEKSVDRDQVRVGEWATYTVTATVADHPARNVVVSDVSLPEGMPCDLREAELEVNGQDVDDFQLDVSGNGFAAHLGDLAAGDVATITYRAQVRDEALMGTSVVNTATLTADSLEEPLRDDASVTVPPDEPGITLEKSADRDVIQVGERVAYTVEASVPEDGGCAENVVIGDVSLPEAMAIDMASIRAWLNGRELTPVSADIEGNAFSVPLEDLRPGETVTITYDAVASSDALAGTDVVNVAELTSDSLDEPLTAEATVRVVGRDQTVLDKRASVESARPGETVRYTVTAVAGTDLADAAITDAGLPEGMGANVETMVVTVNGEPAEVEPEARGTGFAVALGDLAAGDRVEVSYEATVGDQLAVAEAANTAELSSPDLPEPVGDTEVVELPGDPEQPDDPDDSGDPGDPDDPNDPDSPLVKTADRDEARVGDTVSYEITLTPEADLTEAVLTDAGLPDGVAIDEEGLTVEVNGEGGEGLAPVFEEGENVFVLDLGDLAAGDVVTVGSEATVKDEGLAGETLENTAELESPDLEEPLFSTATVEVTDDEPGPSGTPGPGAPAPSAGPSGGGSLPETGQSDPAVLLTLFGVGVAVAGVALGVHRLTRGGDGR